MTGQSATGDGVDRIPVGGYHDGRYLQSGFYDPSAETVMVKSNGGPDPTIEVSVEQWLEWFPSDPSRVSERSWRMYTLLQSGELLERPVCAEAECQRRVTEQEVELSESCERADGVFCDSHLRGMYTLWELEPWREPAEVFEEVRESEVCLESFEDPEGVLEGVSIPRDLKPEA